MNYAVYDYKVAFFKLAHTKLSGNPRLVHVWYTFEVSVSVAVKINKGEFRTVIKYFYFKKWTAAQQ